MKLTLAAPFLVLAGIAQANLACYCTGPDGSHPDRIANECCTGTTGITFPDGRDRVGSFDGANGWCLLQTDGLGFTQNQMIAVWADCCRASGGRDNDRNPIMWGGNCRNR